MWCSQQNHTKATCYNLCTPQSSFGGWGGGGGGGAYSRYSYLTALLFIYFNYVHVCTCTCVIVYRRPYHPGATEEGQNSGREPPKSELYIPLLTVY